MDLNDLLNGLMADMKKVSDTASMIGEPVKLGKSHMVPLLGVTIGFGTATTDLSGNGVARGGKMDGGGAGGSMVVTPRAFVVVDGEGVPQLISLRDGKYAEVQPSIELAAAARKLEAPAPAQLEARKAGPGAPDTKTWVGGGGVGGKAPDEESDR